jgi:hypothetical protein
MASHCFNEEFFVPGFLSRFEQIKKGLAAQYERNMFYTHTSGAADSVADKAKLQRLSQRAFRAKIDGDSKLGKEIAEEIR